MNAGFHRGTEDAINIMAVTFISRQVQQLPGNGGGDTDDVHIFAKPANHKWIGGHAVIDGIIEIVNLAGVVNRQAADSGVRLDLDEWRAIFIIFAIIGIEYAAAGAGAKGQVMDASQFHPVGTISVPFRR